MTVGIADTKKVVAAVVVLTIIFNFVIAYNSRGVKRIVAENQTNEALYD